MSQIRIKDSMYFDHLSCSWEQLKKVKASVSGTAHGTSKIPKIYHAQSFPNGA